MAKDAGAASISPLPYKGYMVQNCAHTVFVSDRGSHPPSSHTHAPHRGTKELWGEGGA